MTTHARFVGAGVQPLVDAVKAAGGEPGDLSSAVWQATWARGYDDVVAPAPAIRLKEDGIVIFARAVDAFRFAAVIDTGHALWALVARGVLPPLGARVRIVPAFVAGEIGWDVTVIETLGLGLAIRFGTKPAIDQAWIEHLRAAIQRIDGAEVDRRKAIVAERRALVTIELVKPLSEELEQLHEQLRLHVDAETAATPQERAAYERGNEKQRKHIIEKVIDRRGKRYNEQLKVLRARVPLLQAAYEKRSAANAEARAGIAELEDAASRSRGVTERAVIVVQQLGAIESAGLLIEYDAAALDGLGAADFAEISRTIELLHDTIPRRSH